MDGAKGLNVVTGALGFTGKYITEILLKKGAPVRTITGHTGRPNPFGGKIEVRRLRFDDPSKLVEDLRGAETVYNTYWVRFNYGNTTFGQAVANSQNLIRAAAEAGVKRFVHISIANPDENSTSHYYKGKAQIERTLAGSGLSYAILRPTVLFGKEDVLVNNIAWLLRKLPVFAIPGLGDYRIQPGYVGDVAKLAVELASGTENIVVDAVGPETYSYAELVRLIRDTVGSTALILKTPPYASYLMSKFIDPFVGDTLITRDEIAELMRERLVSYAPPLCKTRISLWLKERSNEIGRSYASEIKRHFK